MDLEKSFDICVGIERALRELLQRLTRFLAERLNRMVDVGKSAAARAWQRKFPGYSTTRHPEPKLHIAAMGVERLTAEVKVLLCGARGRNLGATIQTLNLRLRRWAAYFKPMQTKPTSLTTWANSGTDPTSFLVRRIPAQTVNGVSLDASVLRNRLRCLSGVIVRLARYRHGIRLLLRGHRRRGSRWLGECRRVLRRGCLGGSLLDDAAGFRHGIRRDRRRIGRIRLAIRRSWSRRLRDRGRGWRRSYFRYRFRLVAGAVARDQSGRGNGYDQGGHRGFEDIRNRLYSSQRLS